MRWRDIFGDEDWARRDLWRGDIRTKVLHVIASVAHLLRIGRPEEALRVLEKAKHEFAEHPIVWGQASAIRHALGDTEGARADLAVRMALEPDSDAAARSVARSLMDEGYVEGARAVLEAAWRRRAKWRRRSLKDKARFFDVLTETEGRAPKQ